MPTPTPSVPPQEYFTRLWPDPQTGPFWLRLWVKQVDDRPAIVGVEMWGVEPPTAEVTLTDTTAITRKDIRDLRLDKLLDGWRAMMGSYARATVDTHYAKAPDKEAKLARFERRLGVKHTGRPRLTDEFLREVADIYTKAVDKGDPAPALQVQMKLGAATVETARGWIRQARKREVDGRPLLEPYKLKGKGD
jgi:hypothetical protein